MNITPLDNNTKAYFSVPYSQ